jgi:Rps23 Pro-64 3,4-dihydroxylase Tpa1-like proline 4-hydroxylase
MDYYTVSLLIGVASIIASLATVAYRLGSRLTGVEKDIEALRRDVNAGFNRLANVINSVGEYIVVYLGSRGVLKPEDVYILRTVIKGLASTATNPFTEAERRRLLELVDKDDLTIEEAEELHRLAWKFYEEYIDKTPDAFKVLLYAAAMLGITYRKYALGKQTSQPPT